MQFNIQEGQAIVDPLTGEESFAVCPITNCPHVLELDLQSISNEVQQQQQQLFFTPCKDCNHVGENWICIICNGIFCSRYIKGHMAEHNLQNNNHYVALSFSDLSFWCYSCDSYITNYNLSQLRKLFQKAKFNEGEFQQNQQITEKDDNKFNEIKDKVGQSNGFFVVDDVNESNVFQTLILSQFSQDITLQKGVLKGYTSKISKIVKAQFLVKSDDEKEEVVGSVIRFNKNASNLAKGKLTFLMSEIEGFPSYTSIQFEKIQVGEEVVELTVFIQDS